MAWCLIKHRDNLSLLANILNPFSPFMAKDQFHTHTKQRVQHGFIYFNR
jgi:hypothetical protein